jgi:flagellar hook-associated protein 1 FlgK
MSSALMSIGTRAMFANYASMQTTGHNIANAQTPGYSRQTVDLATSGGQTTGAGFFGKGVDVTTVQRASDQFLTKQAQTASSLAAMDDTRATNLKQLEAVFPPGDNGVGSAVGSFMNSFVDLANTPSDSSARQVILSDAAEVADRFATAGSQLDRLQSGVTSDLKSSVTQLNALATQVAKLNGDIAGLRGSSDSPNDLLDQRDQAIKQIGNLIKVQTISASDGSLGVFIAGGQRLVLGAAAQSLKVIPDASDSSRSALALNDSGTLQPLTDDLLVGGSLSGLLKYQNEDLVSARNQLGQLAASVSARVNEVQSFGIDIGSPSGAGDPIFATGAPVAIANSHNVRDSSNQFASSIAMTITDGSQLKASNYSLQSDGTGSGSYVVTRESDGVQFSMVPSGSDFQYTRLSDGAAMGTSLDGFKLTITGSPASTDRFELQPVGRAAVSMKRVLDDPRGIAAASPETAVMGVTNTGTATVAGLSVVDTSNDPSVSVAIKFTDATGGYDYTLTDSSGNVTSSGSAQWTAGSPIALNGFELNLNGVPGNGDTIAVSKTAHPQTNNGNALAMVALRDESFVGRDMLLDGTLGDGEIATDAYASVLANVGVRVQGAQTTATISAATAQQADLDVASKSGVNLDEEAGRLIQFQQGYQAAAKVLQVAQAVFDTLLQMAH